MMKMLIRILDAIPMVGYAIIVLVFFAFALFLTDWLAHRKKHAL